MEEKRECPHRGRFLMFIEQIPNTMKWTFLFLVVSLLGSTASASAQRITIALDNARMEKVLAAITEQTGLGVAYSDQVVDLDRRVSVHFTDAELRNVLDRIMEGTSLAYEVRNGKIYLFEKRAEGVAAPQQGKKVTGVVVDSKGEPIIGANVVERGTTNGTITDLDGKFTLEVSDNAVLQFSYIGFNTQNIEVKGQTSFQIELRENTQDLDEVVVVGYGTMKKSDLTGSVSNLKSEKLLSKPVVNVGQALSGKASGVEIFENGGTPDGKVRIRIRGNNSINSSNDPLYVVDGVIGVNNINLLNPSEIESLEVLKDASATAIYGARGANGVIMITTKRGIKGKPVISYDGYVSVGNPSKKIDLMNAEEWWANYNVTMDNAAKYDPTGYAQGKYNRVDPADYPLLFDSNGNPIYDTDWQDEAYQTTIDHNHQISIRGGADNTLYSIHMGYIHKDALMKNGYLDRYSGRINVDSELRSWLKVGANMSFNYNKGNDNYNSYGIKRLIQEGIPIIPVKYPDGTWGSNRDFPGAVQDTPSRYLEERVDETSNFQTLADLYLDFKITKDLSFKATFAVDASSKKRNFYSGKDLIQFSKTQGGVATIDTERQLYWQNENYFNYTKEFNSNHRLNAMLGLSWQQRSAELVSTTSQNFSDDFYQWHNLGAGTVLITPSSEDWAWSLNSYFARFNYTLKDRYLFTATGRYDGSSKFGKNNKYAFFPSFAFAWRASEESFLKDVDFVDNLKVRTSVGLTGNQEIGNYTFFQNLSSDNVIFGNEYYSALYRSSFGNPDLKWEKTLQYDAGIDLSILNQRVSVSLDYYYKKTSDLLLEAPIPSSSGLESVMRNIGSVRNQGFELTLNTHNVKTEDFNWMSTVLFSLNRNKILQLGENNEDIFPAPRHAQGDLLILRVGEPVGSLWGYQRLGTWSESEAEQAAVYGRLPGDVKYADLNNDGMINSEDQTIIGCTSPDWTMTFSNTFYYKNFDFSFDLRFVFGNDVVNCATHNAEDRSGVANGWKSNLNAWTPSNQNTMIAQRRPMTTYYDSYPDSHWAQNGSFVRGQNFVLGYTFDKELLRKISLQDLRVYVSAQNLFCITNYNGYDPEVSTYEGNAFGQGIDDFSEPKARTFTFGLSVKF